jgi:hypothetical protein
VLGPTQPARPGVSRSSRSPPRRRGNGLRGTFGQSRAWTLTVRAPGASATLAPGPTPATAAPPPGVAPPAPPGGLAAAPAAIPAHGVAFTARVTPSAVYVGQQATYELTVAVSSRGESAHPSESRVRARRVARRARVRPPGHSPGGRVGGPPRVPPRALRAHAGPGARAEARLTVRARGGRRLLQPGAHRPPYGPTGCSSPRSRPRAAAGPWSGTARWGRCARRAHFGAGTACGGRAGVQHRRRGSPGTSRCSRGLDSPFPWADLVVAGTPAVVDSAAAQLRGRRTFTWLLTPRAPGRFATPPCPTRTSTRPPAPTPPPSHPRCPSTSRRAPHPA